MTTNLQIGLAYAIGKTENKENPRINLSDILGEKYKNYVLLRLNNTTSSNVEDPVVLYRNDTLDCPRIITMSTKFFTIGQLIQMFSEALSCDMKNRK